MLVDTWMLIALSQIALVALITAIFALFRARRVASRNRLLEERCASARKALEQARTLLEAPRAADASNDSEASGQSDWKTVLRDRLSSLNNPCGDAEPDAAGEASGDSEDETTGDNSATEGAPEVTPALALEKLLLQHLVEEDETDLIANVSQLLTLESHPSPDQSLPAEDSEHAARLAELESENHQLLEKIQALEVSHEALKAAATEVSGESQPVKEEELKALVKQFTQDSRDMLSCIHNLELENQALKDKLDATAPADSGEADEDAA